MPGKPLHIADEAARSGIRPLPSGRIVKGLGRAGDAKHGGINRRVVVGEVCARDRISKDDSKLAKILEGIRRGGYVRMSYRQRQSVNVRARLITEEKTREAGRTIIAIMFPVHEA